MYKQFQSVVLSGLLLLTVICFVGCSEAKGKGKRKTTTITNPTAPGQATWEYWRSLKLIGDELDSVETEKEIESDADLVAAMKRGRSIAQEVGSRIKSLHVHNVAPEAVELGAAYIQFANRAAVLFWEVEVWASRRHELYNRAESVETLVESFVRGFCGDPLGTYNDLRSDAASLDSNGRELQQKYATLEEVLAELESREFSVRAQLSQRFNREFPALD